MKKKISLKWKIFGSFLIFTGILLVLLWVLQILCLNDFYVYVKRKEVKEITEDARKLVSAEDSDDLSEALETLALDNGVSLLVTDADGTSLYSAQYNPRGTMNTLPQDTFKELYAQAQASGGETEIEYTGSMQLEDGMPGQMPPADPGQTKGLSGRQDTESSQDHADQPGQTGQGGLQPEVDKKEHDQSVIYVCIIPAKEQEMVLFVSAMLTPVDATVSTLKVQLALLTVLLIGISLLLAWLASRAISKSLIRLNLSAKAMAEGDYRVSFDEDDYGEIAQLSDTLNYAVTELAKTDDLRKELIANVSHDLRTPLTMIRAYSEVMRDIPEENTPENVQVIIDETDRLTNLVNDMLSVSQLEAGTIELCQEKFDLTDLMRQVMLRYGKLKEQDGYVMEFVADGEVYIMGDADKIAQVLCNLINNAINYTGADKKIIVRQSLHEHHVRVDVIDSGEGIAAQDIPYVWDRYYKGDKARKRLVSGTGLGLSIVQKILELHGATYGVESKPGMGADFWFAFEMAEK